MARHARRMTDWEANSPQSIVPVRTLTTIVTAQVLFPRSVLSTAGPRATLTRLLLELGVTAITGGVDIIVHMAILVVSIDAVSAIQVYDPTDVNDLNKAGVLWQRQVFMQQATVHGQWYRERIDIKAQRKLREDQVLAFFIEPNGGTIDHHIGGRALLKLT